MQALQYSLHDISSKGLDDTCSRLYHFQVTDELDSDGLVFASVYVEELLLKKVLSTYTFPLGFIFSLNPSCFSSRNRFKISFKVLLAALSASLFRAAE